MFTLSALTPGAAFGVPFGLAMLAVIALFAVLLVVAYLASVVVRQADRADLPAVLLGLSHVISSLSGLLPWGRPTSLPGLPESSPQEQIPAPTVVLVRHEPELRSARRGEQR